MKQYHCCKASSFSASLQNLHISRNSKVYCCIQNCSFFAMLSHIYKLHALFNFFKIHLILSLSMPSLPNGLFFLQAFSPKPCIQPSSSPYLSHAPSTSSFLILSPNNIRRLVQIMEILVMQFFPTSCYFLRLWPKHLQHLRVSHAYFFL